MKTLFEIWNELPLKSDKGDIHSYLSVYEQILAPYRETAINILEIGLFKGASLLMWEQYFEGKVYGIDCDERPHGGMGDLRPLIEEGIHNIFILDAESPYEVKRKFDGIKFDVVIEDAGHDVLQQLKIFDTFKPYLNTGFIYCIEDIQNIHNSRFLFEELEDEKYRVMIIDNREIKKRYDDVLVIITDKP